MILELDETPLKKEINQETILYNNSFEIPCSKIDISFSKDQGNQYAVEIQEIKAMYELEIENLKLENCNLRQKLRTVQDNSNFIGIFNIYEEEIKRLEASIKVLREEYVKNIALIERNIEIINNDDEEISILQRKHKTSVKDLLNIIKTLENKILEKEKEHSEIKKNERKWNLSRKCFENVSKKSMALENVVGKQTKNLQSNEATFQEMIEELERLNTEVSLLRKQVNEMNNVNEKLNEELKIMKDIASTSGMPEETLKRIHKNLITPFKVQGDFVISLITRLQQELQDKKQACFLDNIIHEVQIIATALEQSQIREKNLFELLLELQNRIDNDDTSFSKETIKLLRKALFSQLIV